jgi:uncharacterized protein
MTETIETIERKATRKKVELRASGGEKRSIGGYAAVFNRRSENLGGFVERIAPSFFNKSAADGWPHVIARYNHDDNFLLGATKNDTLRLSIDNTGLSYTVDLPECRGDILELVGRGDLAHSSFAFQVFEDTWMPSEQGYPLRTLVSGKLIDVAPVSTPAYRDTTVALKSFARHMNVPYEDVRKLARENELRRLLVRTDRTSTAPRQPAAQVHDLEHTERRALSVAEAKARVQAKAPMSGAAALARTLAKKHPAALASDSPSPMCRPASVDARRARVQLSGKRWSHT